MKDNSVNNEGGNEMNKEVNNMNMNDGDMSTIIDLVNKMKYEVSAEQMAELAGCATPLTQTEFCDWHAKIDEMDFSSDDRSWINDEVVAKLRSTLHQVADKSREMGDRIVRFGKRIVEFVMDAVRRYPQTTKALVVVAALMFLASLIPFIGGIVQSLVMFIGGGVALLRFVGELSDNMSAHRIA